MCWTVLLAVFILIVPAAAAQVEEGAFPIAATGYNIQPQVAYSPVSNSFIVVWLQTADILSYNLTQVQAVRLQAAGVLSIEKTIRISRPSKKKRQAPGTAVTYHPLMSRFLVIWQEIEGEDRTLFLTTMDDFGTFDHRTSILARQKAPLLAAPLIAVDPAGGGAMAAWTKLEDGKVKTVVTSFDPNDPNHLVDPRNTYELGNGRFKVARALVYAGDTFRLINCLVSPDRGRCVAITGQDFDPATATRISQSSLTRYKIRRSMSISAVQAEDPAQTLVSYDQTGFEFEDSVLAIMLVGDEGRTVAGPTKLTERDDMSGESRMLPSADDGFARIMWLERPDGKFVLKLQAVTEDGVFLGEPQVIRTTAQPIGNAAMAYGQYGAEVLVVWSEDKPAGGVNLLCRLVALQ